MNLSSALCAKEKLGFLYKIPRTIFVTKGLLAAFFQRKPLFFVPSERLKLHVTYLERAYSLFRTSFQTSVSPVFLTHNNFWPWVAYNYQTTTRGHWLFSNKSSIACGFEPKLTEFGYQNYNPFMSFFLLFINKLSNLSPSLFRKKRLYVCGWEAVQNAAHFEVELFRSLSWCSSQLNFTSEIEYTEKKIYKTKKCQLWNPSRDCLSLARAFHLLFLPLGNKMTLLPKQQKHWVVVDVDHSKNKRGCVFPRIENFSSSMTSLRDGYPER